MGRPVKHGGDREREGSAVTRGAADRRGAEPARQFARRIGRDEDRLAASQEGAEFRREDEVARTPVLREDVQIGHGQQGAELRCRKQASPGEVRQAGRRGPHGRCHGAVADHEHVNRRIGPQKPRGLDQHGNTLFPSKITGIKRKAAVRRDSESLSDLADAVRTGVDIGPYPIAEHDGRGDALPAQTVRHRIRDGHHGVKSAPHGTFKPASRPQQRPNPAEIARRECRIRFEILYMQHRAGADEPRRKEGRRRGEQGGLDADHRPGPDLQGAPHDHRRGHQCETQRRQETPCPARAEDQGAVRDPHGGLPPHHPLARPAGRDPP